MLEADAAHPVGHREQDVVVIEVSLAEQGIGLGHEIAEGFQMFRLYRELAGLVGHHVQLDRVAHLPRLRITPGEDRRID